MLGPCVDELLHPFRHVGDGVVGLARRRDLAAEVLLEHPRLLVVVGLGAGVDLRALAGRELVVCQTPDALRRPAHLDRPGHGTALLHDVGHLVGEDAVAIAGARPVGAPVEEDVGAVREGVGVDHPAGATGLRRVMRPHPGQIGPEERLQRVTRPRLEGTAAGARPAHGGLDVLTHRTAGGPDTFRRRARRRAGRIRRGGARRAARELPAQPVGFHLGDVVDCADLQAGARLGWRDRPLQECVHHAVSRGPLQREQLPDGGVVPRRGPLGGTTPLAVLAGLRTRLAVRVLLLVRFRAHAFPSRRVQSTCCPLAVVRHARSGTSVGHG